MPRPFGSKNKIKENATGEVVQYRKARSIANTLKIINNIRKEKDLKPISKKPKTPKKIVISPEHKRLIEIEIALKLFPDILSEEGFILTDKQEEQFIEEIKKRYDLIKSGKEPLPDLNK